MTKKALITGITGQDGSYLAEFLLNMGYEVYGLVRRTSTVRYERIRHIQDKISIVSGDMNDQTSLYRVINEVRPTEVYNLAAQSFVQTSWQQPVFTGDVTGLGVTRILDAILLVDPSIRFYQASSSEMFGKVQEVPQKETTPFYPRSPYGVAKVYGHWITVNYRESYNLHASSGILFNHECVIASTPVFIRKNGMIDLLPIDEVVPHTTETNRLTTDVTADDAFEVWDANGWAQVTCMTATWNGDKANKTVHRIASHGAVYHATSDHVVFTCEDDQPVEKPASTVETGDSLALIPLPEPTEVETISADEAWLLGVLAAEGVVYTEGGFIVTSRDETRLEAIAEGWHHITSGSTTRADSGDLILLADAACINTLHSELYTRSGDKRIPLRVLNAPCEPRLAFLQAFSGDTLHEFNFKTASAVLAAGLYWLAHNTLNQRAVILTENRDGELYYQIRLEDVSTPPMEAVVLAETIDYTEWLFDLATTSGTFHAGVGQGWIHNSPRRGLEFVTRKVSYNAAKIKLGMANELRMGNLDAQRDWGFAGDYVKAMWKMLQLDTPDDFVVATGETHSVERLLEVAFSTVDLHWRNYVVQDPQFMRPAEVDLLIGDPTKAGQALGWEPEVSFEQLIQMMVEADLALLKSGNYE